MSTSTTTPKEITKPLSKLDRIAIALESIEKSLETIAYELTGGSDVSAIAHSVDKLSDTIHRKL